MLLSIFFLNKGICERYDLYIHSYFIVCSPACIFNRCILTDECEEFDKIKINKISRLYEISCMSRLYEISCMTDLEKGARCMDDGEFLITTDKYKVALYGLFKLTKNI